MELEQTLGAIERYLAETEQKSPFFVVTESAAEGRAILGYWNKLLRTQVVTVSSACSAKQPNAYPDMDRLSEALTHLDKATLLLGLGEFYQIAKTKEAESALSAMLGLHPNQKLILLCRGSKIFCKLRQFAQNDPKFGERSVSFLNEKQPFPELDRVLPDLPIEGLPHFCAALKRLEEMADEPAPIRVKTKTPFSFSNDLQSAYSLCLEKTRFILDESWLTRDQWNAFLNDSSEAALRSAPVGSWQNFLLMKQPSAHIDYLRFAAKSALNSDSYPQSIAFALSELEPSDPLFDAYYSERKAILSQNPRLFSEQEAARFIHAILEKRRPILPYLTDLTHRERCAVIEFLSDQSELPDLKLLERAYPDLAHYAANFDGPPKFSFIFSYFNDYKRQKLLNRIEPEFMEIVQRYALERPYEQLPSRKSLLDRAGGDCYLYWIDALGAESLSFLQALAKERNLAFEAELAHAELPTLTSCNSEFYDLFQGQKHKDSKQLDEIKHHGDQQSSGQKPLYLEKELAVLRLEFEQIERILASEQAQTVILTSDHGASRLAVLADSQNRFEMAEKGLHSGRCCPKSDCDQAPLCATECQLPDGTPFYALANYDRFRGGRKAEFEVHGGASLEEVVIPFCRISLPKALPITIQLDTLKIPRNKPILSFRSSRTLVAPWFKLDSHQFEVALKTQNQYQIQLDSALKAGRYKGQLMQQSEPVCELEFEIETLGIKNKKMLF